MGITKICNNCHLEKSIDEFYKSKNCIGGYRHDCILCKLNSNKELRKIKGDTYNENARNKYVKIDYALEFPIKASKIHSNKYNYSRSIYQGNKTKLIIVCPNHGEFLQTPSDHLSGKSCPNCIMSSYEEKVESFLTKNNLKYTFDYPIIIEGIELYFDFYIEELNLFIEINDKQHYEHIKFFDKTIEEFERQQYFDSLKINYCKNNNLKLITIPYWEFKNIEQILKEDFEI